VVIGVHRWEGFGVAAMAAALCLSIARLPTGLPFRTISVTFGVVMV
jgi:hypothetical protein